MNAKLAFHFKINPSELTDEEFALEWAKLNWVLADEAKKWQQRK